MRHETVKYHNDLNGVVHFTGWTSAELNFFFAIIAKARDKGTDLLTFSKGDLKELTETAEKKNERLNKTIRDLRRHLMGLRYTEITENENEYIEDEMLLFDRFRIRGKEDITSIEIGLSRNYEYILNKLTANFTSFELSEFLGLKSVYSKQLYRHLKQWRTVGHKEFKINEFKEILNVPESYEQRDINKRVMKPILNELSKAFKGLTVEPIKAKKPGAPVAAYLFTWEPEQTGEWTEEKQYTPVYNDSKKKGKTPELPEWYDIVDETPADPELLEKALRLQRGEKA